MLALCVVALLGSALLVVALDGPVRSASAFISALLAAAAVLAALEVPLVPGTLAFIGAGGVGVLVLCTVLLLNLTPDERGQRRFHVTRALSLFALAYVGARLGGVVWTGTQGAPLVAPALPDDVSTALFEQHGIALALAGLALCTAVVSAFVLVRRRA